MTCKSSMAHEIGAGAKLDRLLLQSVNHLKRASRKTGRPSFSASTIFPPPTDPGCGPGLRVLRQVVQFGRPALRGVFGGHDTGFRDLAEVQAVANHFETRGLFGVFELETGSNTGENRMKGCRNVTVDVTPSRCEAAGTTAGPNSSGRSRSRELDRIWAA